MAETTLIAYYSWDGNTRKIAEMIQQTYGGTLFEIKPAVPYTRNYSALVSQSRKEVKEGYRPELAEDTDVKDYSRIYVGSPNWCSSIAPPVATFLSNHDFSGKEVIPFGSHGGGGLFCIERAVKRLCPYSKILDHMCR